MGKLKLGDHDAMAQEILEHLEKRWNNDALISEADFIAGATVVMQALIDTDEVWSPAAPWVWMIMGNRSILAYYMARRGKEIQAARVQAKMDKDFIRRAHADEMAEFLRVVVNNTEPYKTYDYDTSAFIREQALHLLEEIDEYPEDSDD